MSGISTLRPPVIKATIPDKFTGQTEKLELFLNNMQAYFDVTNIPDDKEAGVLRLNMSDSVLLILIN